MKIFSYDTAHLQRPEIFGDSDIIRMKGFLIQNAAKAVKDERTPHHPRYKLDCINTCRAAVEILLFDSSAIPLTLSSAHASFNITTKDLRISNLMDSLAKVGIVDAGIEIAVKGVHRDRMVKISDSTRWLVPVALDRSIWHSILAMVGDVKGYSVFVISLCDDQHASLITVDHRNYPAVRLYWSDQTSHHPVSAEDRLVKGRKEQGWERMAGNGSMKTVPRKLDAYVLYAIKKFWCDCGKDNKTDCCRGKCFPNIKLWRLRKPEGNSDFRMAQAR